MEHRIIHVLVSLIDLSVSDSESQMKGLRKGEKGKSLHKSVPNRGQVLKLSGVGYRWSQTELLGSKGKLRRIMLDAGTSFPMPYILPRSISARIAGGTSLHCKRIGVPFHVRGQTLTCIESLRPRSPFTGQGVIDSSRQYPKLKSTKTSKK